MFRRYLWHLLVLAAQSSWKAVNGLEGAALAGAAALWFGQIELLPRSYASAKVGNWLLTFALYAVLAWIVLFLLRLIFSAAY
jgi:hypothetical protein